MSGAAPPLSRPATLLTVAGSGVMFLVGGALGARLGGQSVVGAGFAFLMFVAMACVAGLCVVVELCTGSKGRGRVVLLASVAIACVPIGGIAGLVWHGRRCSWRNEEVREVLARELPGRVDAHVAAHGGFPAELEEVWDQAWPRPIEPWYVDYDAYETHWAVHLSTRGAPTFVVHTYSSHSGEWRQH